MNKIDKILNHLGTYGSITSIEAFSKYRVTRLSAIIFVLRKREYQIESVWETSIDKDGNKSRYVKYVMEGI